jgi:hypothetical protein
VKLPVPAAVAGGLLFVLLATANGAGYRYGTSDQAFYVPAVVRALTPDAFPRDRALIDAQGRFMVLEELIAALMRGSGVSLELLFLAGYLLSLALVFAALLLIGRHMYRSGWALVALAAAFTLRHRIPRTSANSFEPYFHPRVLAFALGALALAAVLRRRTWLAVLLVGAAAVVHVTTALWFAVLIGVALAVLDATMRRLALLGGGAAAALVLWGAVSGRLAPAFAPMDSLWLQAVASKDSLFATTWPLWAWTTNFAFLLVLWLAHARRRQRGIATPEEQAVVLGATALVGLFVLTLPLVAARAAFPVQLQIPRVFWLVDFLALVFLVGAFKPGTATLRAVAVLLVLLSVGRGAYVMLVERPERALFAVGLVDSPWHDALAWLSRQPADVHVLADPGHAWKHATSVRVGAARDVFLEEVKDSALAIYSREVAARVVERQEVLGDFAGLTAARAQALARRYDLDYLLTDVEMPLPLAYRNQQFRVYVLGEGVHDGPAHRPEGRETRSGPTASSKMPPAATAGRDRRAVSARWGS